MSSSLQELFDRHASIVIDDWAYQTNPELAELAVKVCELGGLRIADVTKKGMTVWRSHATIEVRELTASGKVFVRDGETVKRTVSVNLPVEWQPVEVTTLGDAEPRYV